MFHTTRRETEEDYKRIISLVRDSTMILLRDTLVYLPPFCDLLRGMIYENMMHAYRSYVHVDQHVARGDGPIIGLEKACRSRSPTLSAAQQPDK